VTDDRPAVDPIEAITALQQKLADLESTTAARLLRRPTGDIEPSLRKTAKPDTLLLQGQTISRATYAQLWTWVAENGLAGAGLPFGAGDGSTTFTLPDMRGKAAVGATAVDPVGKSFGSATATLTVAQMPVHKHGLSSHDGHSHALSNNGGHAHGTSGGGHYAHWQGGGLVAAGGHAVPLQSSAGQGEHSHSMTAEGVAHTLNMSTEGGGKPHTMDNAGEGQPFFIVQPSYAVNWLIWC
jgi:microcystin-dependent protein